MIAFLVTLDKRSIKQLCALNYQTRLQEVLA